MSTVRETESQLLRAIAEIKQATLADRIGLSESQLSKLMHDGLVDRVAKVVVHAGFRLVPAQEPQYPPGHVSAMEALARLYMDRVRLDGGAP